MTVPLAWRNLTADKRRLVTSTIGIVFAVVLMLMQLGFRNALVDSQVEVIRQMNADLVIISAGKIQLNRSDSFPRRRISQALSVHGVVSASPVYMALQSAFWKSPIDGTTHRVRVLGVDPDDPVFGSDPIKSQVHLLRQPDAVLFDSECRKHIGRPALGTVSELTRRRVHVVGLFTLGADFLIDGTVITSDRTFLNLFPDYRAIDPQLSRVEIGLLLASPDANLEDLVRVLKLLLPADVDVMTRSRFIEWERDYWMNDSPVGLVFNLGTVVGFIVGVVICSQILFADIAEKMPQFATLKAIGYDNRYLRAVILKQAALLTLFGFLPGVLVSWCLYQLIAWLTGLLMDMSINLVITVFILTLAMCITSGLLAARKVLALHPADVF